MSSAWRPKSDHRTAKYFLGSKMHEVAGSSVALHYCNRLVPGQQYRYMFRDDPGGQALDRETEAARFIKNCKTDPRIAMKGTISGRLRRFEPDRYFDNRISRQKYNATTEFRGVAARAFQERKKKYPPPHFEFRRKLQWTQLIKCGKGFGTNPERTQGG